MPQKKYFLLKKRKKFCYNIEFFLCNTYSYVFDGLPYIVYYMENVRQFIFMTNNPRKVASPENISCVRNNLLILCINLKQITTVVYFVNFTFEYYVTICVCRYVWCVVKTFKVKIWTCVFIHVSGFSNIVYSKCYHIKIVGLLSLLKVNILGFMEA